MDQEDWQTHNKLSGCTQILLEGEMYCDVEFLVGEERRLMKAHKLILAVRSPVFERMFYGPLAETKNPIVIPDIEPEGFASLLRYCYYDCQNINPDSVFSTLSAAKKYIVPVLEDHCRGIVYLNLGVETIWKTYTWSLTESDDGVCQWCRDYIQQDAKSVELALKLSSFLSISQETLFDMLQLNHVVTKEEGQGDERIDEKAEEEREHRVDEDTMWLLKIDLPEKEAEEYPFGILISEIELFKACIQWAEAECLRQELKPSGANKRRVLGDCLHLIRFSTMLLADVVNIVSPTEVLTLEEKYNLVEGAYGKGASRSESKILVRNQSVLLQMKSKFGINFTVKHSQFSDRKLEYSCIVIRPEKRLEVSKVWFICPDYEQTKRLFNVVITNKYGGQCLCRNIRPKKEASYLACVQFKDVQLQAGVQYRIEVECTHSTWLSCFAYRRAVNQMPLAKETPEVVDLTVVSSWRNHHIVGLTVRLI